MPSSPRSLLVSVSWAALACLELVLVAHLLFGFGPHRLFEDGVYNAVIVGASALLIARGLAGGSEARAWLAIGIGQALWSGADILWSLEYAMLEEPPYPSWSDLGWLLFYPCCYVGVVLLLRSRGTHVDRSLWLDGLIAALGLGAVVAAVVLPPLVEGGFEGDVVTVAVNLAYPVGDALLISVLIGMSALLGWRPDRTWRWLGAGLVLAGIADIAYLSAVAGGAYEDHSLITALWPAAALATAGAAWQPAAARATGRVEGFRVVLVPAVFTLAAFGVLVLDHFSVVNHGAAALAAAALLVVFLRAWMTFREHQALIGQTRREAHTDALTGLANRRRFTADLDRRRLSASPEDPVFLLLFDLNGFKAYNDAFGHPAGDALLSRLGQALGAAAQPHGRAYRMGGDEFCVLATGGPQTRELLTHACREALAEQGEGFSITAACGRFLIDSPRIEVADALREADRRMYLDKDSGRLSAGGQSTAVLVRVLAERDADLSEHVGGVAALARKVADHLRFTEVETTRLVRAAALHDIGMAAIPDAILDKPGPLDADEQAFMRRHPLIGERIISAAPALGEVAAIVRATHERFDGAGYPDRLRGTDIPLGARIVAVCNAFEAMVSPRPYRTGGMTTGGALAELRRCAGTQFDPAIVEAFAAALGAAGDTHAAAA